MGKGAKKWKENNRVLIMTKIPNPDYNHFLLRERGEEERKKKGGVGVPKRLRTKIFYSWPHLLLANEKGRKCDLPPGEEGKRAIVFRSCQQEYSGKRSLFHRLPKWSRQCSKQIQTAQQRHLHEGEPPRSGSRALDDPAEETREPLPRSFHTKLMHFVICSWELSQPWGSTIPKPKWALHNHKTRVRLVASVQYQSKTW